MTSISSGCLLEPATGFAGSSTIMALSLGFVCAFAVLDNQLSSVYCLNVLGNGAVVDSTALMGCEGGHVTCLAAARLAASFHILPDMAFSNRLLANGSITSVMHSEVSPAFLLSQWRTFSSSSVASFHSGHAVRALNCIQPSLLFGNLYWLSVSILYVFQEHWTSPRIWFWRHEPCLLVLPFGTTARNLHLVDLKCCQALAWLLEDMLPHSLTRSASSCWSTLSR